MTKTLSYEDRTALAGILQRNGLAQHEHDHVIDLIDHTVTTKEKLLTLSYMTQVHMDRSRWLDRYKGHDCDTWTVAEWTNAMQAEAGEAGNISKKIRRGDFAHSQEATFNATRELEMELADVLAYLNLLVGHFSLDINQAVIDKFAITNHKFGYDGRSM